MWDIRYRPLKFADVLGQPGTVQLLKSRLKNGTALDTSYIFAGGHGQGKTTLARIFARAALCLDIDKNDPEPCNACDNCTAILEGAPGAFEEKDAASNGTIDNVRSMTDDLPFMVAGAAKRIWLWDEAHRMSVGAQDVLLKPIEDKKVVCIFCTTEAEKIRGPIRSRSEEYTIRKVTRDDVLARMRLVLEAEKVPFEDDAVLIVIDYSGGHVRDVLNRLEMIAQLGPVTVSTVRDYLNLGVVSVYYNTLLALDNPKAALELLEQALERSAPDDVAAGLAEAAMNAYRMANGMFADFVYVDRTLAQKVHEKFGVMTLKLAEHFSSRARGATRISLACDLVALAGGRIPEQTSAAPAPIVIAVAPSAAPVAAPVQAAPVQAAPVQAAPVQAPTPGPVAAPPPVQAPAVAAVAAAPVSNVKRFQPLGSGDPQALTELDDRVINNFPRRPSYVAQSIPFSFKGGEADDDDRILSPDEWRQEWARTWVRGRSSGG